LVGRGQAAAAGLPVVSPHPTASQETDMTTDVRIAWRKLSLLELAQDLGNVSKACRLVGYSRQQFYEIRPNYQTFGGEGLVDNMRGQSRHYAV
jgi:hypothetical protein